MPKSYTLTAASQTLTASGNLQNTETVVVGGKTYTFQDTLTDSDGNVKVGATAAASLDNLYAAINLGSGAGTAYAASMTINTEVYATAETDTTVVVKAYTPGSVGNLIASTETAANAAWGAATLANGAGHVTGWVENVLSLSQVNSDLQRLLYELTPKAD